VRRAAALLLVLAACASTADSQIRAATARYVQLVESMDSAAIAAMFAPDGQLVVPGRASLRGPAEIRQFLDGFKDFHVLSEEMTVDQVHVHGATADSTGTYHQRVRLPQGNVVEPQGHYAIQWTKSGDGQWRFARMSTW
jgi:uncharacterized protein (TIGR02246 family)